jgi:hypothetical protein
MVPPAAKPLIGWVEPTSAALSAGLIARVGRRFMDAPRAVSALPGTARRMSLRLQTGIAEFLLVTRLRVRNTKVLPAQSADVLERGADVVNVTCQHWFAAPGARRGMATRHRTRL